MPSNIVAYEWPLNGTIHIAYETGDNHIHEMIRGQEEMWRDGHLHELSAGVTGLWNYIDLTQATGAPLAENSLLAAYAWEAGKTKQVVYVSGDGHIHELMSGLDGAWRHSDLTSASGAPVAGEAALAGYAWEAGGTKQVVYTGADGDVYELVCGQDGRRSFADLMALTGTPLPVGTALATYAWETGRAKQVVYVGGNHHIYELQMPLQGTWEHTDITQLLGVPEASQDIIAAHEWTPAFAKHIVYLDTAENPHIHSLLLEHGGQWRHTDVTGFTGSQSLV